MILYVFGMTHMHSVHRQNNQSKLRCVASVISVSPDSFTLNLGFHRNWAVFASVLSIQLC